jgi:hypothetical protein
MRLEAYGRPVERDLDETSCARCHFRDVAEPRVLGRVTSAKRLLASEKSPDKIQGFAIR